MNNPQHTDQAPAFELKGSALTLMVLYVLDGNAETLASQLARKFGQAPALLRNAPLVLDLSAVREAGEIAFAPLLSALRRLHFVPVAVRSGSALQHEEALAAGLGILSESRGNRESELPVEPPAPVPAPTSPAEAKKERPAPVRAPLKVITQPVRSGQRITAEGDLIVLAAVGAGSEILAAGNIHVYGALRGRALAGARGDTEARVFCLNFNPELVAIAGEYLVNEELDPQHVDQQVLVSLEDDRLKVESFGTSSPR